MCVWDQSPLSHRAVRALLGLRFPQDSEGACSQWGIARVTASIAAAYTLGECVGPSPRPLLVLTGAEKCVVPFSVSAQLHGQTPPIHVAGTTQQCRGPHPWLPVSIPSRVPAYIVLWSSIRCKCAPFFFLLSSSFVSHSLCPCRPSASSFLFRMCSPPRSWSRRLLVPWCHPGTFVFPP